jgi:hypothetical protein
VDALLPDDCPVVLPVSLAVAAALIWPPSWGESLAPARLQDRSIAHASGAHPAG